MPKMKSVSGAAKRFKKTGTGKIKRKRAFFPGGYRQFPRQFPRLIEPPRREAAPVQRRDRVAPARRVVSRWQL